MIFALALTSCAIISSTPGEEYEISHLRVVFLDEADPGQMGGSDGQDCCDDDASTRAGIQAARGGRRRVLRFPYQHYLLPQNEL